MTPRRQLLRAGVALLVLLGPLGATWALLDGLPAYGEGDESISVGELLGEGTNLSAPLGSLIVFAVALALSRRDDRWGAAGDVAALLVTVVMVIASYAEPWVPAQADSPAVLLVLFHIALYVLAATVIIAAARDLRLRRQAMHRPEVTVSP